MPAMKLEEYLATVDLERLLARLGARNFGVLVEEIRHFTENEAAKRDKIALGYFGEAGVEQIVGSIVTQLTSAPKLRSDSQILDMGAGSGFFTLKVADRLSRFLPKARFYAMDATPGMLLALARKTGKVTPFLGIAENIAGSMMEARAYAEVPERFDAVFSTLMLHHCPDIGEVFRSVRRVLKPAGKAVVIDMCRHPFTEFRQEMGDLHLGFDPEEIKQAAEAVFSTVTVEKMPGIHCRSSGRSAELFTAKMQ